LLLSAFGYVREALEEIELAALYEIDGRHEEVLEILKKGYENRDSEMHSLK